jgi:preprotein translocase subunit SecG
VDIILLVLHVVLSLGIITLVLLQKGAGASAGAAFGGGGAGSVFGATGSANFLSKSTAILATCFFVNSLALAYLAAHREVKTDSVLDIITAPVSESSAPADESIAEPVPMADVPAAADAVPAADYNPESDIPSAEDIPEDAPMEAADVPPADVPPADVPAPAGE